MNGRERWEAIMKGDEPDRVSVECQLSMGHIIKNSGVSPAEFYLKYNDIYIDTLIRLTNDYQFDGFSLEKWGVDIEYLESQVDNIVDKPNGQLIVWKSGDQTFCPVNDYPIEIPKVKPVKKPLTDIKVSELLNSDGYKIQTKDLPQVFMKPYRDALKKAGDTLSVQSYFFSPLSILMLVYGIEDTLFGLLDYPDICKKLLDEIADGCILWVDTLIDTGFRVIAISAPYEGMGFISLGMYKEFGVPFAKRIIGYLKKRGILTYMHMCGYINDRLEEIVNLGVDGIECFDPPPIGNVDLEDAVKRVGGRVWLKGNMDPVNTVFKKSPAEIYEDAVKRIKIAYSTKRYVLSTACSVPPDTPPENLKVLIKAANDYGWY